MIKLKNNKKLFTSLLRYINYNIKLSDKINNISLVLFLSNDEFFVLKDFHSSTNSIVFTCRDYATKSVVNILDFKNLKFNIHEAINSTDEYTFLNIKEVHSELKIFFKGHGEISIFALLNKVQQGLKNGLNPFLQKEYKKKDLDDKFLKPGLKNWKLFVERFKKYEDFLFICGFGDEVNKINNLILFTKPNITYIEQNKIEKAVEERENIVNSLEKIDDLLMHMKKKIESYNDI